MIESVISPATRVPPRRKDIIDDLDAQYMPSLVDRWDALIHWPKRERAEAGFFAGLLRHAGAVRVLDAAAGTGFHSVTLTAAGFDVTAVDGSAEMLRRAVANGEERGIALRAICADWRDIVEKVGTASTPSSAWEVLFLTCSAIRTAAARWRPSAPP